MKQTPNPLNQRQTFPKGHFNSPLPQVILINNQQWSFLKKYYRMTDRELQIAQYICKGMGNEQIADTLSIRQGTVKTHIRNIYRKTWVRNKIAMLLRFLEDTNSHPAMASD